MRDNFDDPKTWQDWLLHLSAYCPDCRKPEIPENVWNDYLKIKDLALTDKKIKAIAKWTEEKINETYISINADYKNCDFTNNWQKK